MRKNFMKKVVAGMLTAVMAFSHYCMMEVVMLPQMTQRKKKGSSDVITVGFYKVGAESDWRISKLQNQ